MILIGCGARTALVIDLDAGIEARPPPRSCWHLPNCIEADLTTPEGDELAYREIGEVLPLSTKTWLHGARNDETSMSVLVSRRAVVGVHSFDFDDGSVFVNIGRSTSGCPLASDIRLSTVDLDSGGVTEGTFAGMQVGCEENFGVRNGRFRLTAP
jgi:hypothetical protein